MDPNAPAKGLKKKQVVQAVQRLKAKEKPKLDKDITMADVLQQRRLSTPMQRTHAT